MERQLNYRRQMSSYLCRNISKRWPKSTLCRKARDKIRILCINKKQIHHVCPRGRQLAQRCNTCKVWRKRCRQRWEKTRIEWWRQDRAPQDRYKAFHQDKQLVKIRRQVHSSHLQPLCSKVQIPQGQNWTKPKMGVTKVLNSLADLKQQTHIQIAETWH